MTDKSDVGADKKIRRRNRQRTTPIRVKEAIVDLVIERGHRNKTQIYKELEGNQDLDGLVPSSWTVGREVDDVLREFGGGDRSGPWSAGRNGGSPAALATLAAVIELTEGRVDALSMAEAGYIGRLAQLVPDLPPFESWRLTRLYIARHARDAPVDDLDALLAFAPWRGPEERERYESASRSGWIAVVPQFILKSIYAGRPLEAAYLKDEDVVEQRRNPEKLDEEISPNTRKMQKVKQVLASPGEHHLGRNEGRDEHLEARMEALIERNHERVRAQDAARPDHERTAPYYDEDDNPRWEDPDAEESSEDVEGRAPDDTPPG